MLRALNLLKLFSIFLFLIILLLVYAYLPIIVNLRPGSTDIQLHKETFFYATIAFFVVVNVVLLAFQKLYENKIRKEDVKAWVRGLTFVINLYITFMIGFIGVINNTAHIKAEGFAYLNYLGPFLVFSWIVGLIYLVQKRS